MKNFFRSDILTTGIAIFAMFFGASNFIFPLETGLIAGSQTIWGILGFTLTAVIFPLFGLISLILFNGDYNEFFNRLGKIPGFLMILISMLIIGPMIAMPRIVTLSHTMLAPFFGNLPLWLFSAFFLFLAFLGTIKESGVLGLLGKVIGPLKVISLIFIIGKGLLFNANSTLDHHHSIINLFWDSFKSGYKTLDVLGGIFFGSIMLTLLRKNPTYQKVTNHRLATLAFKSGVLGLGLLGIIYGAMAYLGAYYGQGLEHLNEGELFSAVSFRILGSHGAFLIALAVILACYSTLIALTTVLAEYTQKTLFKSNIGYSTALMITLMATMIVSNFGLSTILNFSIPIVFTIYPAIIMLMFCNIAYKLIGFKPVKTPVLITLLITLWFTLS